MKTSTVRVRRRLDLGENGQEVLYPLPYRSYVAVLNQAGTAAPTATAVHKNNLLDAGTAVALARTGAGVYTLTLATAFGSAASKVVILLQIESGSTAPLARAVRTSANVVTLSTFNISNAAADLVGNIFVEIRVYS